MVEMPILKTRRLLIRSFEPDDLESIYQILDVDLNEAETGAEKLTSLQERAVWLQWAVLNPNQLARLNQPPYGDRAVVLRSSNTIIGACGYVPCLNYFEQVPGFANLPKPPGESRTSTAFGLFYAISPTYQRQGYAAEAAQALIDYAFQHLRLKRIIAETDYDNLGSIGVMRKLGMRIEKNLYPEPPWLQVVGILENS